MVWTRHILRNAAWPVPLLIALATAAGASAYAAQAPEAPAAQAKDAEKAAAPQGPQPPDGKWLTDAEGRKYFLDKLEKSAPHLRLEGKMVRTRWGIPVEVEREDEQYFYYKVYQLDPKAGMAPPATGPSAAELEKMAATYKADTPEGSQLRFAPFSNGLPTGGQWRNGFDLADMNGDGHLDIVHGPARKSLGYPSIFLSDGKGSWRLWKEAQYPRLPYDYGDAAAGDFNGDGHMDFALGMHLRGLVALVGDGKGGFKEWGKGLDLHVPGKDTEGPPGYTSRTLAVIDWNQDGRQDILALGEGPRLNLTGRDKASLQKSQAFGVVAYLNQGDGSWVRRDQGTSPREIFGDDLALGDFNGDKRRDFVTGSSVMGRQSLVNYAREDGAWDVTDVEMIRPRSYVRAVSVADYNSDGLDDLAIGYLSFELAAWRSGIDILYAQSGGAWTRRPLASREGRIEVSALGSGDLNGDGKADLVALTGEGEGETWVFVNDGKGFFVRQTATGIPAYAGGCRGYHAQLADLDGDGKDEIVAGFAGEGSAMFSPGSCSTGGGLQAWRVAAPAGEAGSR